MNFRYFIIIWTINWPNVSSDMCAKRRLRSVCASIQSNQRLRCPHAKTLHPWLSKTGTVKILIAECFCPYVRLLTFRLKSFVTICVHGVRRSNALVCIPGLSYASLKIFIKWLTQNNIWSLVSKCLTEVAKWYFWLSLTHMYITDKPDCVLLSSY